jgi:hypothetical protein
MVDFSRIDDRTFQRSPIPFFCLASALFAVSCFKKPDLHQVQTSPVPLKEGLRLQQSLEARPSESPAETERRESPVETRPEETTLEETQNILVPSGVLPIVSESKKETRDRSVTVSNTTEVRLTDGTDLSNGKNVSLNLQSSKVKTGVETLLKGNKRKHDILGDKDKLVSLISENDNSQNSNKGGVLALSPAEKQKMQGECEKSSLLQSMPPEYCSCDIGEFDEQVCRLNLTR